MENNKRFRVHVRRGEVFFFFSRVQTQRECSVEYNEVGKSHCEKGNQFCDAERKSKLRGKVFTFHEALFQHQFQTDSTVFFPECPNLSKRFGRESDADGSYVCKYHL